MTLFKGTFFDTPDNPMTGGRLRATRGALLVQDGVIRASGSFEELSAAHPEEPVEDLSEGLVLPGFVDTHVHYPPDPHDRRPGHAPARLAREVGPPRGGPAGQ